LNNHQTNTNLLIKQKFENYAPTPPSHVWNGIQAGIVVKPPFFILYWKSIVAAAIILALVTAGIWYFLVNDLNNAYQHELSDTNIIHNEIGKEDLETEPGKNIDGINNEDIQLNSETKENDINTDVDPDQKPNLNRSGMPVASDKSKNEQFKNSSSIPSNTTETIAVSAGLKEDVSEKDNFEKLSIFNRSNENAKQEINDIDNVYSGEINPLSKSDIDDNYLSLYSGNRAQSLNAISINNLLDTEISDFTKKRTKWSIGFYFAPEMMLSNFDSIEMLTNYSFGVEPTYYINNHLFIRFGLGATYSRDRGFAKLDYLSNDLLGTYEYVYDITFDSVDGEVIPTYHTTTAEVWDTVRHMDINTISNNYVYIQMPALFGYYSSKSKLNWYVYGGPAFNLMVSKQIEKPLEGLDYIDLKNLQTELPERSPYYFQFWLGAGIEYKAGTNLGIAIEPSYRYYFNNVFNSPPYSNSGLSGLSLRVGLVYTIQ